MVNFMVNSDFNGDFYGDFSWPTNGLGLKHQPKRSSLDGLPNIIPKDPTLGMSAKKETQAT